MMEVSLEEEFSQCDFGDVRLTNRLPMIGKQFGERPTLSIPGSLDTRAEMVAAYRFFDNKNVTPECILATHRARTLERISQSEICLLIQDTTELDLTRPKQQVAGSGPLSADSRRGAYLHPMIAVTPDGLNYGTIWHQAWARKSIETGQTQKEKNKRLESTPIEDKESCRWLEGLRAARNVAERCASTQCILVCDSESDIYEVLSETRSTIHGRPLEILIRACQDRATDVPKQHLLATIKNAEAIHQTTVHVSARTAKTRADSSKRGASREARIAELTIKACQVTLRPPFRPDRKLSTVTLNVVLADELAPPPGEIPIQWVLLTSLPITSLEEVLMVIEYYRRRWLIENYFKILKSGCRVEERQFETLRREMNAISVYLVAAWRIHLFVHLGQEVPDLECSMLFDESEWKSVCLIVDKALPSSPPSLNQLIRKIASLGGYVNRSTTKPGYQTLWIGMQRMHDFSLAFQTFGPGSQKGQTESG